MRNALVRTLAISRRGLDASVAMLIACAVALAATSAGAAPVSGKISLIISLEGLAPITITSAGTVDVTGSTIQIAAGAVSQAGPITVPVTGSTSITDLHAVGIANQAATFSLGGITNQLPGEVCAAPAPGEACNSGGGIGGAMGLLGTINIRLIPMVVELPFALDGIGQGGGPMSPYSIDHAGFTTGSAFVGLYNTSSAPAPGQLTVVGGPTLTADGGPGVALVTPTYMFVVASQIPVLTTLIVPIPEPSTLLLLGSGIAGVAWSSRRRRLGSERG